MLAASTPLVCVGAASPAGEPKSVVSSDGVPWWSSKTGDREPALLAPGTWLLATDRRQAPGYNDGAEGLGAGWTARFGGTGAAACVVAGVAALALAKDPLLTPAELKALLLRTAGEARSASGRRGDRVVDAEAAVRAAVESAERRRPAGRLTRSPRSSPPATAARRRVRTAADFSRPHLLVSLARLDCGRSREDLPCR